MQVPGWPLFTKESFSLIYSALLGFGILMFGIQGVPKKPQTIENNLLL